MVGVVVVVGGEIAEEVSPRGCGGRVERGPEPAVLRPRDIPDPGVVVGENAVFRIVVGPVVDDHDLEVLEGLVEQAAQRPGDEGALPVRGHENRNHGVPDLGRRHVPLLSEGSS
jgi:hypothetical protein